MDANIDTIIGVNVTLKGNVYNKGAVEVNGNVEGEVKSDENIIIGQSAKIKGPVIAKKIEVSGEIKGLVDASEKLEIHPTGRVLGDINAKTLIIQEGASFVGKCTMPSNDIDKNKTSESNSSDQVTAEQAPVEEEEKKSDKMGFFGKK